VSFSFCAETRNVAENWHYYHRLLIFTSLEKGLQIETHGWAMCYGTQDQVEGMTAFIEKRKPNYTGK
jgi:enoyl-CoA hydratase/carnithine racemase